jgi:HEPN domain-containing protein
MIPVVPFDDDDMVILEDNHEPGYHNLGRLAAKLQRHEALIEENRSLKHLNEVIMTRCGVREYPRVVNAAVCIQSAVRGLILRRDKAMFDHSLEVLMNASHMFVTRRRFLNCLAAARTISSFWRGEAVRRSPLGNAIRVIRKQRREIISGELRILSLHRQSFATSTRDPDK